MLYALIVMSVVVPAAVGYGQLLRYLLSINNPPTFLRAIAIDGLLGLLVMGTIAIFLNFFIGISTPVVVAVNLLGWGVLAWRVRHQGVRPTWGQIVLVVLLLAFFAVESIRELTYYDTALYHYQCVLWAKAQAVPLGLGNLHNRLSMTTMWFALAALLWLPGMTIASTLAISALTGFLFSCLIADCARHLMLSPTGHRSVSDWFGALCVYGIVHNLFLARMAEMVSLSNDLPPVVATFTLMILLLPRDTDEPFSSRLPIATLMATLSFTAKLSSAPLLAVIGLTLAWRWWRDGLPRVMGKTILASSIMVAIWITRSVWTSGAPLFPSTFLQMSETRWVVRSGPMLVRWIKSWARAPRRPPEEVLANWDWVTPWWQRMLEHEAYWVMAWALAVALVLAPFFVRRLPKAVAAMWLLAAGGVAFWFFMAPDPRFGWGSIFSAAAIPVALVASQVGPLRWRWLPALAAALWLAAVGTAFWFLLARHSWIGWFFVCVITSIPAVIILSQVVPLRFRWLTIPLVAALCLVPLLRAEFKPQMNIAGATWMPQMPPNKWTTRVTLQGEPINIPDDTRTAWDTPIPGTPYFTEHLKIERNAAGMIKEIYIPHPFPTSRPATRNVAATRAAD